MFAFDSSPEKNQPGDNVQEVDTSPKLMERGHIFKATQTCMEASLDDPLCCYLWGKDRGFRVVQKAWRRLSFFALWCYFLRYQRAWSIEGGNAVLGYTDPTDRPGLLGELMDALLYLIYVSQLLINSWEQTMRHLEIMRKIDTASCQALGEKRKWTLQLDIVATVSIRQHRGYGSALVKVLTDKSDLASRGVWLVSSNVEENTRFYNSLGFRTVATIFAGDSNPLWQEQPVPIAIMVREPKRQLPNGLKVKF